MESIKEIISGILGEWSPILIERSEIIQEPVVIDGVIQYVEKTLDKSFYLPDLSYIVASIIFIIAVYSVFRMVGGLVKWRT